MAATLNLSEAGDLKQAAANLFAMMRQLDAVGADAIAVMPIPDKGLGEAINDRLQRAAAPRHEMLKFFPIEAGGWPQAVSPRIRPKSRPIWKNGAANTTAAPVAVETVHDGGGGAVLAICNETRTAIVPQGGNTGLVGAQIPFDGEVLLATAR